VFSAFQHEKVLKRLKHMRKQLLDLKADGGV